MRKQIMYLLITLVIAVCNSVSAQNPEALCLDSFKFAVHQILLDCINNEDSISFDNVELIFRVQVDECGKIAFAEIMKSNLCKLGINIKEKDIISQITEKKFICIREIYYEGKVLPNNKVLLPDNVTIIVRFRSISPSYGSGRLGVRTDTNYGVRGEIGRASCRERVSKLV
jgi:hypothetical protein